MRGSKILEKQKCLIERQIKINNTRRLKQAREQGDLTEEKKAKYEKEFNNVKCMERSRKVTEMYSWVR